VQHILVVDDDRNYTTILRSLLEGEGYTVTTTESAERALEYLDHNEYNLVLLDVVMPEMNGLELCRRIRATSQIPIMFLSVRSDVADKVLGLRAGGDDYLTKPFDPDEVLARIWSLLRRAGQLAQSESQLRRADLTLDLATHTVTLQRTGKIVRLTPAEARLLHVLLKNAGHSMFRDVLGIKSWGPDYANSSNQVDVYIARLRNKIEEDPGEPKLIQTVRGVGYRFEPPKA
jgi:DNA-binding response OmpR family regulator